MHEYLNDERGSVTYFALFEFSAQRQVCDATPCLILLLIATRNSGALMISVQAFVVTSPSTHQCHVSERALYVFIYVYPNLFNQLPL